ncbi:hypothetical protein V1512DRAFT_138837 [Lipomyces arxii]|uniref:uncharacterized protein n=1 Tax=Lipomyces arxii TaxID=56418 RepID=UPI0034CEB906
MIMVETLFTPIKVGNMELKNRVVLAPLTRFRVEDDGSPMSDLVPEYYSKRALIPGTLLIAEATDVSLFAGAYSNVPGIYTEDQVAAWKKVTDAVHSKGSYIFLQIWAIGRINPGNKQTDVYSASATQFDNYPAARSLTIEEIIKLEDDFAAAASTAIKAGFDGVEIHGAHGYLIDQFTESTSNFREDIYGGSVENRSRFLLEILDKVTSAIGDKKVGVRLSPTSNSQIKKMDDPVPTFSYIVKSIQDKHPELAYIHMVEPRISGIEEREVQPGESTDQYRNIFKGPWIAAGGFMPDTAEAYVEAHENTLTAFGRYFISNPDLVAKIKEGLPLTKYDRDSFYTPKSNNGYNTYEYDERLKGKYF